MTDVRNGQFMETDILNLQLLSLGHIEVELPVSVVLLRRTIHPIMAQS